MGSGQWVTIEGTTQAATSHYPSDFFKINLCIYF